MNPTLSYLLGKRMWVVPNINVWGEISSFTSGLLLTETEGAAKRILFSSFALGGSAQQIFFQDLIDERGNRLPELLTRPKVIVSPKNDLPVVVQGSETAKSFNLTKTTSSDRTALVDLLIIEMG